MKVYHRTSRANADSTRDDIDTFLQSVKARLDAAFMPRRIQRRYIEDVLDLRMILLAKVSESARLDQASTRLPGHGTPEREEAVVRAAIEQMLGAFWPDDDEHAREQGGTMSDAPWYSPDHNPDIPRERRRGLEVWRLRDAPGRIHTCELRDDSAVGAGWDVQFLTNDEVQFSRRCATERHARDIADMARTDNIRGGWREP